MSVREEDLPSSMPKRLSEDVDALAILLAAGHSKRLPADLPKQLLPLDGVSVVARAARALADAGGVVGVLAVHPLGLGDEIEAELEGIPGHIPGVAGGVSRQESVALGFAALPEGPDLVLIHDAARPLATPALAERVLVAAHRHGAAVPVRGITETVKELAGEMVVRTLDRERLAVSQTPQGFRRGLLARALASAEEEGYEATDEAALVERYGGKVAAVPGEPWNLKITEPDDLDLAAWYLERW